MIEEKDLARIEGPSMKKLAGATAVAILIALVILFTAILPGEYGIDPLETGAMLGLTQLSEAAAEYAPASADAANAVAPAQTGTYKAEENIYKVDAQDMLLVPGQGVELKYHMQKGASMVYAWKADGKLQFEFHGEPDQKPNKDYYDSYELDNKAGKQQSFGTFTAPSTGIHGWFWENKTDKEIRFRLTTAGFYDAAKMFAGGPPEDYPVEDVN